MTLPLSHAVLLGIVEGLTEFLPVSSTGHLILTSHVLSSRGAQTAAIDAYLVIIQLGALLSAVWYYRSTYAALCAGLLRREAAALRLLRNLILAAAPVLVIGLLFGKLIKAHLFGPTTVAAALLFGGLVMVGMDFYVSRRAESAPKKAAQDDATQLSATGALLVGAVQALALWPGTSRSMACIIGGQLAGLSTAAAADFTFLLALPTLGAATLYELMKGGPQLISTVGPAPLCLGLVVAFAVGLLVIAAFLRYLRRFGLWPFGCYRIAFGLILLAVL
jgi:undecaprenyl-diphosphatase